MIHTDLTTLDALTAGAPPLPRAACRCANAALLGFGVYTSTLRAEHFWAQVLHETGGLMHFVENMNYSSERMMAVWPKRFPTLSSTKGYSHEPVRLANYVYGGRLGNTQPDDGWRYIGRGFLQLTGRANYERVGRALGVDFVTDPNLVLASEYMLPASGEIWRSSGCNEAADGDSLEDVTARINGGLVGLAERRQWLGRVRRAKLVQIA